jgi:hypothetical protein
MRGFRKQARSLPPASTPCILNVVPTHYTSLNAICIERRSGFPYALRLHSEESKCELLWDAVLLS